jgi:hypothetical protein
VLPGTLLMSFPLDLQDGCFLFHVGTRKGTGRVWPIPFAAIFIVGFSSALGLGGRAPGQSANSTLPIKNGLRPEESSPSGTSSA